MAFTTPKDTTERPTLLCLVVRCEWHKSENPYYLMRRGTSAFALIDILALPAYEELDWRFVALDPDSELAWTAWRAAHPDAA